MTLAAVAAAAEQSARVQMLAGMLQTSAVLGSPAQEPVQVEEHMRRFDMAAGTHFAAVQQVHTVLILADYMSDMAGAEDSALAAEPGYTSVDTTLLKHALAVVMVLFLHKDASAVAADDELEALIALGVAVWSTPAVCVCRASMWSSRRVGVPLASPSIPPCRSSLMT